MCQKLTEQDVEELRADINGLLRKTQAPKPNLNKAEVKALAELKRDKDRIVLTGHKGVAMVVLHRENYIKMAKNQLAESAYRTLDRDPTNKLKAKLILILRRIKRETYMDEGMYKIMYPTGCIPKFYGLPKIHKTGTPLRPIVSSWGSVTYGVAKVLTRVLKPLVGKSPHCIQSTRDFVNRVKGVTLLPGECLCSYNVSALFVSVPIDPALNIIKDLLEKDYTLWDRCVLSVQNIIEHLGFCLHNTYFFL